MAVLAPLTWKKIDANTREAIGPDGVVEGMTVKTEGTYVVSRRDDKTGEFVTIDRRRRYGDAKELLTLVYSVKRELERAEDQRGKLTDGDAATVAVETLLREMNTTK